MITKIEGTCQFQECTKPATHIASGRYDYRNDTRGHQKPDCYCKEHANVVADEGSPEYLCDCPNCGCIFGVN